jgi:hypothetical protein
MLPWLVAVLIALNLALFWWGRQHEVPIEPQLPPLAAAPQQIQLLDEGSGLAAPPRPAADTAEPPAPVTDTLAQPNESVPPDSTPMAQAEQAATLSEDRNTGPDEGAPADFPPAIEPIESLAPDEPAPEPPSADVPAPAPAKDPAGGPGVEAALPAAAAATATASAPKVVKKRKAKRRTRKPPPAAPVEVPLEFQ